MKHIIIAAHGSRVETANEEIATIARHLQNQHPAHAISAAYMEFGSPSIPHALGAAIDQGAKEITVFPYFLVAGAHIGKDIPAILDDCRKSHPDVDIRMLDYLGSDKTAMAGLVGKSLQLF